METFLVYCIPCSLIGMFMAGMITAGAKSKAGHIIGFILVSVIITAIFAGMFTMEWNGDQNTWNEGQCECGGSYEFANASRYRNSTTYYWACDTCGHIIQTHHPMR